MAVHDKPESFLKKNSRQLLILCLLLVACTLTVYHPVGRNGFVDYDDDVYITTNWHVQSGMHWTGMGWVFTSFDGGNWHPLTWLSHTFDNQLFKLNPVGHHYTGLLLHCVNALLLFLLLVDATRRIWTSLAVSCIFAIHPLNVESVAWAAERKNVLSMMFLLLALWAYGRYARKPSVVRYTAVFLAYACGLMAKPQVITLPFLLLLWDYWPLHRLKFGESSANPSREPVRPLWLVIEKLPLFALSAVDAFITLKAQHSVNAIRSANRYPFAIRLRNAVCAYPEYLWKTLWPAHLAPLYPHPGASLRTWQVAAACVFLIAVSALVIARVRARPGRRYLVVGWFWFLGALFPMLGLIQVGEQAIADRYMYVAMIGVLIIVCWGVTEWLAVHRRYDLFVVSALALWLAVLGALTYRQVGFWRNSETLWSHALAVTRDNYVAHLNLGDALLSQGRIQEASAQFQAAVLIRPDDPAVLLNFATVERRAGNFALALEGDQSLLRVTSDRSFRAVALTNLGLDYRCLKDYDHARQSYAAALNLQPNSARAFIGLGVIAQRTGDFAEAAKNYSSAVEAEPGDVEYLLLAQVLQQNGQTAAAQTALQESKKRSTDFDRTQQAVLSVLAR